LSAYNVFWKKGAVSKTVAAPSAPRVLDAISPVPFLSQDYAGRWDTASTPSL